MQRIKNQVTVISSVSLICGIKALIHDVVANNGQPIVERFLANADDSIEKIEVVRGQGRLLFVNIHLLR